MNDILCLSIDAESDAGSALAKQFGVSGYPTLLFLNADGSARDVIRGYMPEKPFHDEVKRIKSGVGTICALRREIESDAEDLAKRFELLKKLGAFNDQAGVEAQRSAIANLIDAGKGFVASDVNSRWELAQKLKGANLNELAEDQVVAIRRLDPEGKSLPMRRIAFDALTGSRPAKENLGALETFLAEETYGEILFDGWYLIYTTHNRAANKTRDVDVAGRARREARRAGVELWKHTPEQHRAKLGNQLAWTAYEAAGELSAQEKAWALSVAEIAMKASDEDVNIIDTFACCLFINGHVQEALAQVDRCIELDPDNKDWRKRRKEFSADRE